MIDSSEIRCLAFSYEEAEEIIKEWTTRAKPVYEGCVVRAFVGDEPFEFAEVLSEVRPDLSIKSTAITIYSEIGYIYPRRGADVIVIDGIQERL